PRMRPMMAIAVSAPGRLELMDRLSTRWPRRREARHDVLMHEHDRAPDEERDRGRRAVAAEHRQQSGAEREQAEPAGAEGAQANARPNLERAGDQVGDADAAQRA